MAAVRRVTIHHEGAGAPTDNVQRFLGAEKYSIGIGQTLFRVERSPQDSFITNGQGGKRSLQVCLSGDRRFHAVTDADIEMIRQALADARGRGWVTDQPEVFFHGDTDGTECPGTHTAERRTAIEAACRAGAPVPLEVAPVVPPMNRPPLRLPPVVADHKDPQVGGAWVLAEDGAVFAFAGARFAGGANGRTWFRGEKAARIELPAAGDVGLLNGRQVPSVYVIVAQSGRRFALPFDRP
jgi:hypothetical protein